MNYVNGIAAGVASQETLEYMSIKAGVSIDVIMETIISNPESQTTKYFQKHMVAAYNELIK